MRVSLVSRTLHATKAGSRVVGIQFSEERFNPQVFHILLDELAAAQDAKCPAVLHGAFGTFCSGLDLSFVKCGDSTAQSRERFVHELELMTQLLLFIWNTPLPVVAAVTGSAKREGSLLAQACDARVVLLGQKLQRIESDDLSYSLPLYQRAIDALEERKNETEKTIEEQFAATSSEAVAKAADVAAQLHTPDFAEKKERRVANAVKILMDGEKEFIRASTAAVFADWETMKRTFQ